MASIQITISPRNPGKFESSGAVGEAMYDIVCEGFADDTTEECDTSYSLLTFPEGVTVLDAHGEPDYSFFGAIVTEDSQGFVDVETYDTAEEARAEFDRIAQEIAEAEAEFADE